MWTLLILVVVTVGFSMLLSWGASTHLDQMDPADRARLDVTNASFSGLILGQLAIAVLGALVVTSEFSTGGIKPTLAAVPNRLRVLAAKGISFAVVAFGVGLITAFGSFYASMPFWSHQGLAVHLGDPGVTRAVIGCALYILGSGLFGFALGAVIRHTAGAITAAVGLLLIVPLILNALPGAWGKWIFEHFTANAGSMIMTTVPQTKGLAPWTGYITFTIWWLVPMVIGAYLMKRRDA